MITITSRIRIEEPLESWRGRPRLSGHWRQTEANVRIVLSGLVGSCLSLLDRARKVKTSEARPDECIEVLLEP